MMKSKRFHRKGFKEAREKVESEMENQFQSEIVKDMRSSNYVIEKDGVKVYLAKVRMTRFEKRHFIHLQRRTALTNYRLWVSVCSEFARISDFAGASKGVSL